jgi:3'-phosphoadenosine 5'-phosphosulfate sulfotransferase (PAPS reductase)/FAD synthetase
MNRVLVWFSCGAASAVAAKMAVAKYGDRCEVLYCDTLAYEHPDNTRFMADVAKWIGKEIKLLKSAKYADIFDVFDKTGWLIGVGGARCTTELKKNVRKQYQREGDLHIFGLTADESKRIDRFEDQNNDVKVEWILHDNDVKKNDCYRTLQAAGIDLPEMYKLGYNNNNCIGCVKGQSGYWNKIRVDFPDAFARMAKQERKMNAAINKVYVKGKRIRVFLDELDPKAGRNVPLPDIECGALCVTAEEKPELVSRYDSLD